MSTNTIDTEKTPNTIPRPVADWNRYGNRTGTETERTGTDLEADHYRIGTAI